MLPSTADLRNTTFSPRHTVLTVAHSQMQLADFLAAFCGFSNLSFIVCSMGACQWVNDTSGPLFPSSPPPLAGLILIPVQLKQGWVQLLTLQARGVGMLQFYTRLFVLLLSHFVLYVSQFMSTLVWRFRLDFFLCCSENRFWD